MCDDDPLGAAELPGGLPSDDGALGLERARGRRPASAQGDARPSGLPSGDGVAWVAPLVQRVARLRQEGVYELLLYVYADGRRGLAIRNAKKPYRLECL